MANSMPFEMGVSARCVIYCPCGLRSVFDRFRAIAHEGEVDKRVQFTIEELYRVRARGFETEGFASVVKALDLVRPRPLSLSSRMKQCCQLPGAELFCAVSIYKDVQ